MTFVGKLLVIVQFMLSICFMAFAGAVYTHQTNWRVENQKTTDKLNAANRDLKAEVDKRTDLQTTLTAKVNAAEDKAKAATNEQRLTADLAKKLKEEVDLLNSNLSTETSLKKSAQEEANIRKEEARILTTVNDKLNKELNQKNTVTRTQDETLFSRETELKSLSEKYDVMVAQVATFTKVLAANGFSTDPKSYSTVNSPTPLVFGRVEEAEPKGKSGKERVQISVGSDDGVTEGATLFVYRIGERSKFLAQIRIELVKPDQAVGVVIPGTKNGVIEKGDYVSTKLN